MLIVTPGWMTLGRTRQSLNTSELKLGISRTVPGDYFWVSKWISASCSGSSWGRYKCFDTEWAHSHKISALPATSTPSPSPPYSPSDAEISVAPATNPPTAAGHAEVYPPVALQSPRRVGGQAALQPADSPRWDLPLQPQPRRASPRCQPTQRATKGMQAVEASNNSCVSVRGVDMCDWVSGVDRAPLQSWTQFMFVSIREKERSLLGDLSSDIACVISLPQVLPSQHRHLLRSFLENGFGWFLA